MRNKAMGVFALSMINVAAVLSIVNFPETAEFGCRIVFYIGAGALFFFVPVALVSAELASTFPEDGGMYLWIKEAFGPKWGLAAVLMQWMNSLPWFATVLVFVATASAYVWNPALAESRLYVYAAIVVSMWLCTFASFRGIRAYAFLSAFGAIAGTLLPAFFIILLAGIHLWNAKPEIPVSPGAFLPDLRRPGDWMLLAGMMVSIAGIDMPAVHVRDVENPRKNFPRAILISSVLILGTSILGSLSIALIVNPAELSMASGTMEAFHILLKQERLGFLIAPTAFLLIAGALATALSWTLGPSKGLLKAAQEGLAPAWLGATNRFGVPTRILVIQAAVPSVVALLVFVMPTIGNAFWVMMALSSQLYMMMYLLMFAAAISLRRSRPNLERPFRVPGGKAGMLVVAGAGFLTSLAAMICGLIPPESIRAKGAAAGISYSCGLIAGTQLVLWGALLALRMRKKQGKSEGRRVENTFDKPEKRM